MWTNLVKQLDNDFTLERKPNAFDSIAIFTSLFKPYQVRNELYGSRASTSQLLLFINEDDPN